MGTRTLPPNTIIRDSSLTTAVCPLRPGGPKSPWNPRSPRGFIFAKTLEASTVALRSVGPPGRSSASRTPRKNRHPPRRGANILGAFSLAKVSAVCCAACTIVASVLNSDGAKNLADRRRERWREAASPRVFGVAVRLQRRRAPLRRWSGWSTQAMNQGMRRRAHRRGAIWSGVWPKRSSLSSTIVSATARDDPALALVADPEAARSASDAAAAAAERLRRLSSIVQSLSEEEWRPPRRPRDVEVSEGPSWSVKDSAPAEIGRRPDRGTRRRRRRLHGGD